jgi:tRNA G18 (ribose-2'-O)-methylase SpoU
VVIPVGNVGDPRLDEYRNVPDPELLRAHGVFIAEGRHVVRRLLESRLRTRSVLLTPAAHDGLSDVLRGADRVVYVVSQEVMNAITGFNIHRGCLAVGERPPASDWREIVRGTSLVAVLERVANADNVGGIFRSAAAFGAGAVLLGPACADPLYRKAIRTSMGAALMVPFAMLADWPDDLHRLRDEGFTLLAMTPSEDAVPLAALERTGVGQPSGVGQPFRAAILLGHENEGLSADALRAADVRATIPMTSNVDSLNVATAAAIAMYELSAARRSGR